MSIEQKPEKEPGAQKRIAVLIGGGSRLPAIYDYTKDPNNNCEISVVVSHKKESPKIPWAITNGIPAAKFNRVQMQNFLHRDLASYQTEYEENLAAFLNQSDYKPDLVVMAGWDLVMQKAFLEKFTDLGKEYARVINLHPSLLPDDDSDSYTTSDGTVIPAFRGLDCIKQAYDAKSPYTGCTVHFATTTFDVGPVILRKEVKIGQDESLEEVEEKVHQQEDTALIEAIDFCLTKNFSVAKNRIIV